MLDKRFIDIALYRLGTAKSCLKTANATIEIDEYKTSANRSYYAVFHAMRSLLALNQKDFKKHSGVINEFRKLYLQTKILDIKLSDIITQLFSIRNSCDYDDFYLIEKSEVLKQLHNATYFVEQVEKYLNTQISLNEENKL